MPKIKVDDIRMINAALDERDGTIVLRGVLDDQSLKHLLIDDYQREAMPLSSLQSILEAIEKGDRLPDIELGLRGEKFKTMKEADGSETFVLQNECFIIDGQQRRNSALHALALDPERKRIGLGAVVRFSTDRKQERDLFRVLNQLRAKVSPNVLIRNMREDSAAVASLYGLSNSDKKFALAGRVCWQQRMRRSDLVTALALCKVVAMLHSHKVPGKVTSMTWIVQALDKGAKEIGLNVVRENTSAFFDLIDQCWGIKAVQYSGPANHLRTNFMLVLARLV